VALSGIVVGREEGGAKLYENNLNGDTEKISQNTGRATYKCRKCETT